MGAKRYIYETTALSLNKFDQTTNRVLEITTSLTERSDKYRWRSGTRSITEVKVALKNYDLLRECGKFMVRKINPHIKVYVDLDNRRADQNSEMLTTCILAFLSPVTQAKPQAIYDNFKIGGMVYGELFFKGLTDKYIFDNKQTNRYLQNQYNNIPWYMTTFDSDIAKFILEWHSIVILLEACGMVLTDRIKIMWRTFEIYKDT